LPFFNDIWNVVDPYSQPEGKDPQENTFRIQPLEASGMCFADRPPESPEMLPRSGLVCRLAIWSRQCAARA
jgi:hypothetical protein